MSTLSELNHSLQALSEEVGVVLAQNIDLEEKTTLLNQKLQPAINDFERWSDQLLEKEKQLIKSENKVSILKAEIAAIQKQCAHHNNLYALDLKTLDDYECQLTQFSARPPELQQSNNLEVQMLDHWNSLQLALRQL